LQEGIQKYGTIENEVLRHGHARFSDNLSYTFFALSPRDAEACALVVQTRVHRVERLEGAGDDGLSAVEEGVGAACIGS
jgi:hypothetical protein